MRLFICVKFRLGKKRWGDSIRDRWFFQISLWAATTAGFTWLISYANTKGSDLFFDIVEIKILSGRLHIKFFDFNSRLLCLF